MRRVKRHYISLSSRLTYTVTSSKWESEKSTSLNVQLLPIKHLLKVQGKVYLFWYMKAM